MLSAPRRPEPHEPIDHAQLVYELAALVFTATLQIRDGYTITDDQAARQGCAMADRFLAQVELHRRGHEGPT
jgi:hypothetical protein